MPASRFDRTNFGDTSQREVGEEDATQANGSTRGPEAFRRLQSQLEELGDYARLYASAKKDALTSSLRRTLLWATVGVVAASIAVTTVIMATVLAMLGLAQLLGEALGDRLWAGYLIVGGGLLLLLAVSVVMAFTMLQSRFRKQTVQKYERQRQVQRARFGHDANERAQPSS